MSQENVEAQKRAFSAVNRHDLNAYLALNDPDVEFRPEEVELEGVASFHGHEGVRDWWKNLHDVFPDVNIEVVEIRDLGDLIFAPIHLSGHGKGSDAFFKRTLWTVGEWRHGKIVWWRSFQSEAEALEAVGLSE